MSQGLQEPQAHFDSTVGVTQIANLTVAMFFGITSVQTCTYLGRSEHDSKVIKMLVVWLWLLNAAHFVIVSYTQYFYAVTNFGNPEIILRVDGSVLLSVMMITGLSDVIVRGIFAYRLWIFSSKSRWLMSLVCLGCLTNFGETIVVATRVNSLQYFSQFSTTIWEGYVTLISAAATDITITTSLCILLRKHRVGLKRSDSVIRVLVLYSVNTGILTSVCALLCLITFVTTPQNRIYDAFYWNSPTLYLNALLATLNIRQKLREAFDDQKAVTLPIISTHAPMAYGAEVTPISLGQSQNQVHPQVPHTDIIRVGPALNWQSSYIFAVQASEGVV